MTTEKKYNLFLSYSTDPDYEVSRKVESFLERFHNLKVDDSYTLKPLQVCRDGSDFELYKILEDAKRSNDDHEEFTKKAIAQYLKKSENLLVLCSINSAKREYVNYEIEWFFNNKPEGKIFLAITEGEEITLETTNLFSPQIISNNIPYHLAFDFRGSKKESSSWKKVKNFDDELVSLASQLNGFTSGELIPIWRREEEERIRKEKKRLVRQRTILAFVAIIAIIFGVFALLQKNIADNNLRKYKIEEFSRSLRNGEIYVRADEYELALQELKVAYSTTNDPKYSTIKEIKQKTQKLNELLKRCQENLHK